MKIGCCTTMKNYEALCEIGYDYIELSGYDVYNMSDEDFASAVSKIKEFGVPCLGFNAYCRDNLPMVGPDFHEDKIKPYAEKVCERGAKLRISAVGIGSPLARIVPEGWDTSTADMQAGKFLEITAEVAQKYGQTVLFEPLNTEMCNYITSTSDALKMIEKLNIPNLKMVLDFYHMMVMGEDLETIGYAMHQVRHLHISSREPGGKRGYLSEDYFPYIKRAIEIARAHNYDASISIETDAVTDFYDKAKLTYDILTKVCL